MERELGGAAVRPLTRHVPAHGGRERLLPEARAVLACGLLGSRQVAADAAAGAGGILRVGTSQGLGERLGRTLERTAQDGYRAFRYGWSVPQPAERVARVRACELDAAFVRAMTTPRARRGAAAGIRAGSAGRRPARDPPAIGPARHPASAAERHSVCGWRPGRTTRHSMT